MPKSVRLTALLLVMAVAVAACGSSSDDGGQPADSTVPAEKIDYKAIGLWDDGPCDPAKPKLPLGLMTVFESPVLSLKDQATALEASAAAFNARGGANGSCIEVTTCDDGANLDQALGCVRKLDQAGVVATVNDTTTAGQGDISKAMARAKIPRIASNVANEDWGDQNAYPLDAGSTGVVTLMPEALIQQDINKIGVIRVDLAAASALTGIMKQIYGDEAEFLYDAPVPAGTTDYGQFLLASDRKGTDGVVLALGENESVQVVTAGGQLGSDQLLGSALGAFSHATVKDLGDIAKQQVFLWSYPPATADLPVYKALRADLAASGEDGLQPENVRSSAMRSWIALYGLLRMMRDAKMTTFTRDGVTELLQNAKDVPMLGMYGDESWTPNKNHEGIFERAGMNHWGIYRWDPDAKSNGFDGNFVDAGELSFDEVLCGSVLGAPPPC